MPSTKFVNCRVLYEGQLRNMVWLCFWLVKYAINVFPGCLSAGSVGRGLQDHRFPLLTLCIAFCRMPRYIVAVSEIGSKGRKRKNSQQHKKQTKKAKGEVKAEEENAEEQVTEYDCKGAILSPG